MPNRLKYMKGPDGKYRHENDDAWPMVIAQFLPEERVISTADGRRLILQGRERSARDNQWSKWRSIWSTTSDEEMRRLLEKFYPFASESKKLDAICLLTDDGDYVEHTH